MPDPVGDLGVHAHVDELLEPAPLCADDAYRCVPGADELGTRLDDLSQDSREVEAAGEHLTDPEQISQPPLRDHHLVGPLDELCEHRLELELWCGGHASISHRPSAPQPTPTSGRAQSIGPSVESILASPAPAIPAVTPAMSTPPMRPTPMAARGDCPS